MTFDLDGTTPEPDISTNDGLIQELHKQAELLIKVATGGQLIQEVEAEYQHRRQRLVPALDRRSLQYPFPWSDLWLWYDYWKTHLPGYASRRTHIKQLVGPVLDALSGVAVVNPQSKESASQERIPLTMPEQEGTEVKRENEEAAQKQKELTEHSETLSSFNAYQKAALQDLECLLLRFHKVAKHFAKPDKSGNKLPIQEEADVQHMLKGLLLARFDNIIAEDYISHHAGARSRIDFLLAEEKIVIETKMTRNGLDDKEVGNQLIIDIERYQKHTEC